jgi:hypothetical protein
MATTGKANFTSSRAARSSWEYRLIFAASFPIFLFTEAASRCVPRRRSGVQTSRKSIFRAAKQSAETSLPSAFLG